jgi:hypothetical protein
MIVEIVAWCAITYASGKLVNKLRNAQYFSDDALKWAATGWFVIPGTLLIDGALAFHRYMLVKMAKPKTSTLPPSQDGKTI